MNLEADLNYLEEAICQTIRNVDVITRYIRQQFFIILPDADPKGFHSAVEYILREFLK